jgi:hypothetical protein
VPRRPACRCWREDGRRRRPPAGPALKVVEKLLTSIKVRLLGGSPGSLGFKGLKGQPPREECDSLAAGAWLVEF